MRLSRYCHENSYCHKNNCHESNCHESNCHNNNLHDNIGLCKNNRPASCFQAKSAGFTLVELMITVVIIGILVVIGVPSYTRHVQKGYRTDAQGALMAFAQAMERHYTTSGSYLGADGGTSAITSDTAPAIFPAQAPIDGADKKYNLRIREASATSYSLVAVPIDGELMDSDGTVGIRHTGLRGWDKDGGDDPFTGAANQCWKEQC